MGHQRRRRQPGAGRRRLQGLPSGQVQHGRLGGCSARPRDRAVRAPLHHGHRRQPSHLPHGHHAPAQRRSCQRGHRFHGHLLPPLPAWWIPCRLLPRTIPHHRHLRARPSHRKYSCMHAMQTRLLLWHGTIDDPCTCVCTHDRARGCWQCPRR